MMRREMDEPLLIAALRELGFGIQTDPPEEASKSGPARGTKAILCLKLKRMESTFTRKLGFNFAPRVFVGIDYGS